VNETFARRVYQYLVKVAGVPGSAEGENHFIAYFAENPAAIPYRIGGTLGPDTHFTTDAESWYVEADPADLANQPDRMQLAARVNADLAAMRWMYENAPLEAADMEVLAAQMAAGQAPQVPVMFMFDTGFYVRVRWPGWDAIDSQHRVEDALGLFEGADLSYDAGPNGVTRGRIDYVEVLHRNEVPDGRPPVPTMAATDRGFARLTFQDRYGAACSLQKSSLATGQCIWLGVNEATDQHPSRMHLTQDLVTMLLPYLTLFAQTGELPGEVAAAIDHVDATSLPLLLERLHEFLYESLVTRRSCPECAGSLMRNGRHEDGCMLAAVAAAFTAAVPDHDLPGLGLTTSDVTNPEKRS
jgi:hypothetical protein